MKKIVYIVLIYLALTNFSCKLIAQTQPYVVGENTLWENFYLLGVSNDSQWLDFITQKPFGESITSIINIESKKAFNFKNMHGGKFSNNSNWYSMLSANGTLTWLNLTSSHQDSLKNVKNYNFTHNSNFLVAQTFNNNLIFIDLKTGKLESPGISSEYKIHPSQDWVAVALTSEYGDILRVYDLKYNVQYDILNFPHVQFKNILWNKNGNRLAFIFNGDIDKQLNLGVYDTKTKSINTLNNDEVTSKSKNLIIANGDITMNDEGNRVFFYVKNKIKPTSINPSVEVWDTADQVLLSRKKINFEDVDSPLLHVWLIDNGRVNPIESNEFSKSMINPNTEYAIIYNPLKYEPQFHFYQFADLYAINIENGSKQKIIDKQYTAANLIFPSPNGKHLAYFRENHWWVYNIKMDKHTKITNDLQVKFENENSESNNTPSPFGLMAWSSNLNEIFIYDAYDIWKISIDGKQKQKLTQGRKKYISYRLISSPNIPKVDVNVLSMRIPVLNSDEDIFIRAENKKNFSSGFFKMNQKGKLEEIVFKEKRITKLFPIVKNRYVFLEESLNIPPSVTIKNLNSKQSHTVYQSNKDWVNYKWPEKKLLYFNTDFVDSLKGVLIYPVNYNPEKKYPMVVSVYEDYAFYYHRFTLPTINSEVGFNFLNYALNDYFVLLPDVAYVKNKVGKSATQCVLSAIDKVLKVESTVDENNLGLIGHSFGGYETAYIITQTNRFKAAVAGSGVFNLSCKYFDIYKMTGHAEYVRTEHGQYRMKNSFFENKEAYIENSPIYHFDKVTTPLFIWAGKEDPNVNPNQSMQGFLALRRLQKTGVMYLYENETHVLMSPDNQKSLSINIKEWFDTLLK